MFAERVLSRAAPEPSHCPVVGDPCVNKTGRCIHNKCYDLDLTWYAPAISPALSADGYWRVHNISTLPIFTESDWAALQVRTFKQEDLGVQLGGLVAGFALTVITAVVCVVATRKFNAVWRVE